MKLKVNILKTISVLTVLSLSLPSYGSFLKDIQPVSPIEIKKEAKIDIETPKSKIVRVGIGSTSFSTYDWDNAEIYGTGEFELYNNKTYINTYDRSNSIKVS